MNGRVDSGLVAAGRLVSDGIELRDAWVLLEDGVVVELGDGPRPEVEVLAEAPDGVLVPGYIDLHCHGGFGFAFDDGEAAIASARRGHLAHGTTRSLVSLVTASIDDLEARTAAAAAACAADPLLLGIHIEGPFLAHAHRGAHDPGLLRDARPDDVRRLIAAADGRLVQITLAPERPGADEAIELLLAAGVRVAVGHTDAVLEGAADTFDRGASIVTHAFNGMFGLEHRAPGPLPAAFDRSGVTLEIISDGVHVHPRMVKLVFDEAPGRVALITDAMVATGMADGRYLLGSLDVEVRDGVPRTVDTGSIAGSTLTMGRAVRTAVERAGVPLVEAVDAATAVPARAIGVDDRFGRIAPGRVADLVLLDAALGVRDVWADGVRYPPLADPASP
ncbi:N-acetylglucosamine-6-phosphate deacetylase [Pseudoclavibacter chungangensis]|uniref:N-acetylglucosamine-6-phosphate deacetylase n=1 Tax=Pseudoclavibacter chungangensis TaxID=587635 RepID=UPI0017F50CCB|nr:N-acetylglucosamine-6-phosphate deacetylase [Pseudoclavibacter chungangensis]NYJ68081.1 N-acetylglucosamine-6-phosphate deacetylase [Pseudoclavibacter chungangensis]